MNLKLIIAMVKTGNTDRIVEAAKAAGGTGATIIPARGTGIHEAKTFFGLSLEAQTDVVLFVVFEAHVAAVMDAVYEAGRFKEPGTGIAVAVSIEKSLGLESQVDSLRSTAQKP
jgi:nitrogen regulatory protein PII